MANTAASTFSLVFALALGLMIALRVWLALRQIRHVQAHRNTVPQQFADRVELAAHQKAADYGTVRTRFGLILLAVETLVLLTYTFGGGLQALHEFWTARLDGLYYGVALIFSVTLISSLIDLPFSLYTQFVIEERFGFNRMTLKLFCLDLIKQTALGLVIGTPVLLAVLWLMAQMGSLWWLYVWLFWCGFNLLMLCERSLFTLPLLLPAVALLALSLLPLPGCWLAESEALPPFDCEAIDRAAEISGNGMIARNSFIHSTQRGWTLRNISPRSAASSAP